MWRLWSVIYWNVCFWSQTPFRARRTEWLTQISRVSSLASVHSHSTLHGESFPLAPNSESGLFYALSSPDIKQMIPGTTASLCLSHLQPLNTCFCLIFTRMGSTRKECWSPWFCSQMAWVQILTVPLPVGELLHLSGPHLQNGDNSSMCICWVRSL